MSDGADGVLQQQPTTDAGGGADSAPEQSIEEIAKSQGWRGQDEYEGDLSNFVGAEEFVKRKPLFEKIKSQSKKLKELERTVEGISKHYSESVAQAKTRAIAELKAERKEAIELGEVDKVEDLDQRISQVNQMAAPQVVNSVPEPIEKFLEENKSWFNKDEDMTRFATTFNESYLKKNPGKLEDSLAETLKVVKRAYPDKFENTRRTSPPLVEGSTAPTTGGNTKYSTGRLSPEQKMVYEQLVVRHKQMDHATYFKQLEDAGYLGK